ncbi:winged helix-turn-helix domain-containing protein [uncultured Winogradskyella sp.]|uniref:winged helix-turn-helix domain-containing protein n=1 Tax=uncultured Winogradskyella sp. TaxID=395353 RepID=UPI00260D20DE|nr:winged helix-turn-helix domain-containing protein [uncultured Winogradskyella sp.]
MNRITFYILNQLLIIVFIVMASSCSSEYDDDFSERTKIALRAVGNKLLLSNQDSTSLILPVLELEANKYQITFNNTLSFEPSNLVSIIQESIKASRLSEYYRVEVLQCSDREVAYSYQMSAEEESTIVPCGGRYLPEACYIIELKFINKAETTSVKDAIIKTIILLILISIAFLLKNKVTKSKKVNLKNGASEKLGSFYFYPEQNKLVKEAQEIALSKKECELLALFVANPNQIIKRDELTKRVWEDNGVFVGRSLDTYISKLRKKLKSDTSIKLTNVHGVGYKLEVD